MLDPRDTTAAPTLFERRHHSYRHDSPLTVNEVLPTGQAVRVNLWLTETVVGSVKSDGYAFRYVAAER